VSTQIVGEPRGEDLDAAAQMLKLLADRTRLHIMWALLHGEHAVGDLAEHVGVAAPAENEHVLRLVTEALFHADHLTSDAPAHHGRARNQAS